MMTVYEIIAHVKEGLTWTVEVAPWYTARLYDKDQEMDIHWNKAQLQSGNFLLSSILEDPDEDRGAIDKETFDRNLDKAIQCRRNGLNFGDYIDSSERREPKSNDNQLQPD